LIVSSFNPKHGNCSLIIEAADDLWTLRRLIGKGDVVVTRSSRIVKRDDEYSRPDKGERVKVTIALRVEEAHLDSSIEKLRVRGTIIEASDETVNMSGSHSVTLSPGHSVTLRKERWAPLDIGLVNSTKASTHRFLVLAVDRQEAGIGLLSGSHLTVLATIDSGLSGKRSEEQSPKPFLGKVADVVKQEVREGDVVVLAGAGHIKNAVANQIAQELKGSNQIRVIDGFDLSGSDGVRALVKFPGFQEVARGSVLVEMQKLVDEAIKRISGGDGRVAYALARVRQAAVAGAVDSCAVSDDVFSGATNEEELVQTLNAIEERGGKVFLADSSLEFGKQISSFGGIIALLRYALRAY
jgi:protein pelota